jgi:serine/threonine kinase 16
LFSRGFSLIDLVQNKSTKKKFVLKKVQCHSIDDENVALKEIEVLKSIKHHNIIELIDYQKHGKADILNNVISQLYIVLPYFRNGSLLDHLTKRAIKKDYMDSKDVINIFMGICEGVKALHEANPEPIAHRDLKTANICLSSTMEPVIIDLGSATKARLQISGQQQARNLQDLAEERCSICYRPPELFAVESYCTIDERTDIFSLGCVLYAMCYFKSPFDYAFERGDSVALAVLSENIDFPSDSPYDSVNIAFLSGILNDLHCFIFSGYA